VLRHGGVEIFYSGHLKKPLYNANLPRRYYTTYSTLCYMLKVNGEGTIVIMLPVLTVLVTV